MKDKKYTKIIDAHCHFDGRGMGEYLKWSKENNVVQSIICPPSAEIAFHNKRGMDNLHFFIERYKIFSAMAVANPWAGNEAVTLLEHFFKKGVAGLKINSYLQGFNLSDRIVYPLIEVCRAYNKPVYCHTGTPVLAMPSQLFLLATNFKDVTFIMGHMGFADFWYDAVPTAKLADNIYLETSFIDGHNIMCAVEEVGVDRLLFGTDYPKSCPEIEQNKLLRLEKIDSSAMEKIFYRNAAKIFGIKHDY